MERLVMPNFNQIIRGYPWWEIAVELAVIWLCVWLAFRFLRGTRGAGVVKGFIVLLVLLTLTVRVIGTSFGAFGRLNFIYDRFLQLVTILLIVVFQPELRQAMIRLGHARLFRGGARQIERVIDEVSEAVEFLSKSQFGALIAIERSVGLRGLTEGGVRLNTDMSARALQSIFWPNNPLHDLGVVIRGDRIAAACVQFPLAEQGLVGHDLGARHRAAVGLTLDSDAIVIIVSEETGAISIAEQGRIDRAVPRDQVHDELRRRFHMIGREPATAVLEQPALAGENDLAVDGAADKAAA
jgi:diadenylate cyclase